MTVMPIAVGQGRVTGTRCVMLTSDELSQAIVQAQREATVCTRFCTVGGERGESGYAIYHNGLGSSDTSKQIVSHEAVLRLSEQQLIRWLVLWLVATHKRQHFDVNSGSPDRHGLNPT
jgi:hypothetical protein